MNDTGVSGSDITVSLNANGSLVCRYEGQMIIGWRTPKNTTIASNQMYDFRQIQTPHENSSVSRLSINRAGVARNDSNVNGLWTCRSRDSDNIVPIGIFGRGEGE